MTPDQENAYSSLFASANDVQDPTDVSSIGIIYGRYWFWFI